MQADTAVPCAYIRSAASVQFQSQVFRIAYEGIRGAYPSSEVWMQLRVKVA